MDASFAHKSPTPEPDDEPIPEREPEPDEDPVPHPDPVAAPMPPRKNDAADRRPPGRSSVLSASARVDFALLFPYDETGSERMPPPLPFGNRRLISR
ncbi:MAG TPA: hypothetical protein VEC06_21340 [Paucimonas sp.]|nr:hypothetical protein [Paucimonas sp.]